MIEFLSIVNLQKHVKSEIKFSQGVNYILGETDHGKSAIVRAIRWLMFNKPSNTSMMRRGAKKPTISEASIKGTIVKRIRGVSKNCYIIEGVIKKGFGKDVPQEISNLVGCDESLMVQRQAEAYFMIGMSSGAERAKALEKYLELTIISESMTRARKCLFAEKKRKDDLKAVRTELKAVKAKAKSALPFIQAVEELRTLEGAYLSLHKEQDFLEENDSILQSLRSKKTMLEGMMSGDVQKCLTVAQEMTDLKDSLNDMSRVVTMRRDASRIDAVVTLLNEAEVLSKKYEKAYNELRDIAVQQFYRIQTQTQMNLVSKELHEVNSELSKIKVCPTCGGKIK